MKGTTAFQKDEVKLRELILYLAKKSQNDPKYGMTKLNKLLFFIDYWAYVRAGKPVTGADYQRIEHGPALKRMVPIQQQMEQAGECVVQEIEYFGLKQKRLIALRDPILSHFSSDEMGLIDEVLDALRDFGAVALSNYTHQLPAWRAFADGTIIPYEAAFVVLRQPTQREKAHAMTIKPTKVAA